MTLVENIALTPTRDDEQRTRQAKIGRGEQNKAALRRHRLNEARGDAARFGNKTILPPPRTGRLDNHDDDAAKPENQKHGQRDKGGSVLTAGMRKYDRAQAKHRR